MVERRLHTAEVAGSTPAVPIRETQVVEWQTLGTYGMGQADIEPTPKDYESPKQPGEPQDDEKCRLRPQQKFKSSKN